MTPDYTDDMRGIRGFEGSTRQRSHAAQRCGCLIREDTMCKWGEEVTLSVPMPANLSHTNEFRWAEKGIDRCIAPIVQALNDAGIYTANCCCGHGKTDGEIILHDGRVLVVRGAIG